MAILIGENYQVKADRLNIILYSKSQPSNDEKVIERMRKMREVRFGARSEVETVDDGDEKNEKGWIVEGYFSNLKNLFKCLVELEVKKSDLVDLETVANHVDKCYNLIDKVCPNITISSLREDKKIKDKEDESSDSNQLCEIAKLQDVSRLADSDKLDVEIQNAILIVCAKCKERQNE